VIEENFLFGSSFHDANQKVKFFYNISNRSRISNYDLHNQFLHIFMCYGFFGLSLFLLILFYKKKYDLKYIMFLLSIIIIFSTESILNRQMGIIIFSLFFSFINNSTFKKILK
jgi:O-antigen ligase